MQKGIFLQDLNTKLQTVNNAIIQLGDIDDSGKGRKFVSKFIQPGLVKIEGHGIVLLKKETLDASLPTIVGSPVIIQHKDVTEENADELRCGVIANAYFNQPDGWYYVDGIIWDDKAQELINKGWSVSCSYDFLAFNDEGGEENNIHYDKEFTQLNFTHLAIVDNPRYERANIVFNSKINNEEEQKGRWITVKGNHIFIPDGKTLDDVMVEKGWKSEKYANARKINEKKFDESKEREEYFRKEAIKYHELGDERLKWLNVKLAEDEQDRQDEIAKRMMINDSDEWDEIIDKYFEQGKEKQSDDKNRLETENLMKISKDEEKKYRELADEAVKQGKEIDKKIYEEYVDFEQKRQKMLQDRIDKNNYPEPAKSSGSKSSVDKEDMERTFRQVIGTGRNSKETAEILATNIFEKSPNKFSEQEQKVVEKIKEHIDEYLMSEYDKKTPEDISKIKISSDKHLKHFTSSLFISQVNEILKKYNNKTNNSKEQDMAIIDELKKLIFKVENNKENETMVENEKVDKRKLIDEVAGIMKSAGCDDEDIRTAIGKMEKIGYDDSEASADNKKVKNEVDEEEEKKVDNEEDEKEDKKVDNEDEEDKEKVEDLEEEEKKDIKNKCKNSKEESYFDKLNKIYNSAKKVEEPSKSYESRQSRLEAGEKYFG